jgi:glycerophosphoryl diester phosphodiesterase
VPETAPRVPRLIAHRGYPRHYPENSLAGIGAALAAGATGIECDVQLSADHVPLVIHDAALRRTAGIDGDVRDLTAAALEGVEVNESARLGGRFRGTRIPHLAEIAALARAYPAVTFFVDIKRASLRRFGVDTVLDAVLAAWGAAAAPVLVSFDRTLLQRARARAPAPVGWAVERWGDAAPAALAALAPDYVFCAAGNVPAAALLPPGPWRWVIYDVNEAAAAAHFARHGADFVETDAIGELLASPLLRAP